MKNVASSPQVQVHNRYDALGLETEEHVCNGQDPGEAYHAKLIPQQNLIRTTDTRKACKILVIGDSVPRPTLLSRQFL